MLVVAGEGLEGLEEHGQGEDVQETEAPHEAAATSLRHAAHELHEEVDDDADEEYEERGEPHGGVLDAREETLQPEEVRVKHEEAGEVEHGCE